MYCYSWSYLKRFFFNELYPLHVFFPCTGLESIIIKSICIFVLSLFYSTNVPIQIRVVLRHCLKSATIFHQAVPQNKPGRFIMILISPLNVNSLKLKRRDDEFKNSDLELSLEIMTVVICNLIMFIYRENKMWKLLCHSHNIVTRFLLLKGCSLRTYLS